MSAVVSPGLSERVHALGAFDAEACMNCGVCTAICPLGLDVLPRRIFRYVELGLEEQVLAEAETVYSCLLCRLCEATCPAGVHIAGNVRTLRRHLNRSLYGMEV
ncbi:MAG TPA: 4Fe-4S dicluster domain-containing protein [Gaiellaceae bacterium]|nr:4Fe-4S dicluster domain-containing protein [Gaiellaceae bacterium]